MKRISIDPVTRIEGHLKIELSVEGGRIQSARSSGTLFRGLEATLSGRDPRDAGRITQRVCGVCPAAHAVASALALDDVFQIKKEIPKNGRLIRNLILGSNFIHSDLLHFYHLSSLDYLNPGDLAGLKSADPDLQDLETYLGTSDGAPFVPEYSGDYRLGGEVSVDIARDYLAALEIRKKAHQMVAIFGGKMPHNMGTVAGGVTKPPDIDSITKFRSRLEEIKEFVEQRYLPGVLEVADVYGDYFEIGQGVPDFLAYGGFYQDDFSRSHQKTEKGILGGALSLGSEEVEELQLEKITEKVTHSWYTEASNGHPTKSKSQPHPDKEEAYSWVKAPRYYGKPHEVGPAARMLINFRRGNELVRNELKGALNKTGLSVKQIPSVMGRHLARAVECLSIVKMMEEWVNELRPGEPSLTQYELPKSGSGLGLTSAPRGALGHWLRVKDGTIENYQLVVPTTWNASPRDGKGVPGPIEEALIGTRVEEPDSPIEAARIVRSFDPCMACAVH